MRTPSFSIAIIGTGFGGLGAAILLLKAGYTDITLFEKESELGGCWRDNIYPGAACDVPSHLYSYSFAPKADWSRKYASQAEILQYLNDCADRFGVRARIRFNTEVTEAAFDAASGQWQIGLNDGSRHSAQILISACGQLNRPLYPKIKGLNTFTKPAFHSARWRYDVDLRNKTVGVLGTGASAIQFVPEIAQSVAHLKLFQRSAPYVIPKSDRPYSKLEQKLMGVLPGLQVLSRIQQFWVHDARAIGFVPRFSKAMEIPRFFWQRRVQKDIPNAELRAKVTPEHPVGCKRILISNDYYHALNQSHVELVTEEVREITADGVISSSGVHHKVDVLIYGTGFAASDFLAPMKITGRDGLDLNQAWHDGAEAYLGITVNGFPNLFMLYGPNTNLGHSSIVFMLESQIGHTIKSLEHLDAQKGKTLEVAKTVQDRFNTRIQSRIHGSVWEAGCNSWYKNASGKHTNNWPGFTFEYRLATQRFNNNDYVIA